MTEKKVILNEDQKEVMKKAIKDLHFANTTLHELIEKDKLEEKMKHTLTSLMESHFIDMAKILDYESHLIKEQEGRFEQIRQANETIRELKEKIGSEKPIDGLAEQLKSLSSKVKQWWNIEGFHHASEERFYPYGGLSVEFHFMLDHYRTYSDTPVTDRKTKEEHIAHLRHTGFEFADFEKGRSEKLYLIDNEKNRTLLRKMLQNRFPSIEIHSFVNRMSSSDETKYIIRSLDTTIYELSDI